MKKLIWAAGFVVLALAGLVFLLPLALGSDVLRAALARQLSDVAGAEVSFGGPIHFSVLPEFGIVVEDLGYTTGDGAISVASERSVASVNLLSLFSSQIRITGIELHGPRIVLADAQDSAPAPIVEESEASEDIFRVASAYLERLSFDRVEISGGEIAQTRGGVLQPVASDIDLSLSVPGIGAPASLAVSAVIDGKRTALSADIGSLRDLLGRQPAQFSLAIQTEQPPHPALADVKATGRIQLAEDGSYHIAGGEIDSAGEKMRLDVSYTPAERPFVMARIEAGVLDYSDFQPPEAGAGDRSDSAGAAGETLDLSALKGFDADIAVRVEAMRVGEAVARDIALEAELREGLFGVAMRSAQIAEGELTVRLRADLNQPLVQANGSVNVSSVDIASLMALAGQDAPATGRLSSQMQYAFVGTDPAIIAETINLRGTAAISQGAIAVPQLAQIAGANAGRIDALDASVTIEDIATPVAVSGSARWNGENVTFSSSLGLADLLDGRAGATTLNLTSQRLDAGFSGTVGLDGTVAGRADISAASLSQALAWVGQELGTPLGRFSFSGTIANGNSQFSLSDASIALDDIRATGSISVETAGKPALNAALAVDTLDFGALTGGGETGGSSADSGPAPIDLAMLRQFDANIRLSANQIGYGGIKAGPATATLTVADGIARLTVPQAGFYGGVVTADITANGAGNVPAIALAAGMDGVDALPLLHAAAGFEHLEGRLTAELDVTGAGSDTDVFTRALDGKAGVVFSNGALRGIDVAGLVRNVRSLLGGGYTQDAEAKTEFTELSVALDIADGVGKTDNVRLLGPLVRMSGAGQVDLAARTIDMRLDPRVVGSLDGQGSDFDVSGLGMPVMVTGPLAGPSIYPDLSALLADPNRALEALSGIGVSVEDLSTGASETISGLLDTLESDSGAALDGVASGLFEQLTGGQAGNESAGFPFEGGDLLNSILGGGLAGQQNAAQPDAATPLADPASSDVPMPRPDPRDGTSVPAAAPQPAPADPAENILEGIVPQLLPQTSGGETDDFIRGLMDQIEW